MPRGTARRRSTPWPDRWTARTAWSSLVFAVLAAGMLSARADAEDATWKAGVARTVITPQTGVWLAGYGTKRAPEGKLHELWAKALAMEDAQGRARCSSRATSRASPRG